MTSILNIEVSEDGSFLCSVSVEPDAKLLDLKGGIEGETGINKWQQKLFFDGKELRSMTPLAGAAAGQPIQLYLVKYSEHVAELMQQVTEITLDSYVAHWLRNLPDEDKKEYDVIRDAVCRNGYALASAAEELRGNREIVLQAIERNGGALKHASDVLQADKEVVLVAVKKDGMALEFAAEYLKDDPDVVKAAVAQDSRALSFAHSNMKNDKKVAVLVAKPDFTPLIIQVWGLAGLMCSVSVRHDSKVSDITQQVEKETSIPAFEQRLLWNGKELRFKRDIENLPRGEPIGVFLLQRNPEVAKVLKTLSEIEFPNLIRNWVADLPEADRNEYDILIEAVHRNGDTLEVVSPDMQANRDLVLEAVAQCGTALNFTIARFKADKELVLVAVKKAGVALQFASADLRADQDVVLAAIGQDPMSVQFASDALKNSVAVKDKVAAGRGEGKAAPTAMAKASLAERCTNACTVM